MRIGIDIRTAYNPASGKSVYTRNLMRELLAIDKQNTYILYTNKISQSLAEIISRASTGSSLEIKVIHKHPALWHFAAIKDIQKENIDLFFAPASFVIPAFLPKNIKSVIAVHDLVAFIHPRLHQTRATVMEHLFFRRALKKTSHVLTPSKNTKKDLMTLFKYPKEKITVAPLAADSRFFQKPANIEEIKTKYGLPDRFILTVGGLEPRKNADRLADAFLNVREKHPALRLVIAGGKGWKSQNLQKKLARNKDKIIHIENCDFSDLPALYRLAEVFVFPSLYEGFGLPPLEAMASGCPVICSFAGSLMEVCGKSAHYIHPENTQNIAAALEAVLSDKKLREELKEAGSARAKKFSWRKTAEGTLKVINLL